MGYTNGLLHQPLLARLFCPFGGALPDAASAPSSRYDRPDGSRPDVCRIQNWS